MNIKQGWKIGVLLLIAVATSAGLAWYVSSSTPVRVRALQAYESGNYKEALPLLKEWLAADPKTSKAATRSYQQSRAEVR